MKRIYEKIFLDNKNIRDLFDIVLDIESYPKFLPWIKDATIISSTNNYIIADLTVGFDNVKQCYRSNITHEFTEQRAFIQAESHTGPFKHLFTRWDFTAPGALVEDSTLISDRSVVQFLLEFKLKSRLITNLLDPVIMQIHQYTINAFEARAFHLKNKEMQCP